MKEKSANFADSTELKLVLLSDYTPCLIAINRRHRINFFSPQKKFNSKKRSNY